MSLSADDDVILKITDIAKRFGPIVALKSVSLDVRKGRVHTILGENGAGKSTLMKILAGLFKPTAGEILLHGKPYHPRDPQDAGAMGLTIVFQELSLSNNLTVAENILATREPTRAGFIDERALYAKAQAVIDELGLPVRGYDKVGDLSIAQRQLVEIAKGLSIPAEVVIFDEPTSSLSDSEAEILFDIIARLKARGAAVIYISHRMEEIMRLSDDISVIRDGEYITTKKRENVTIDELIALMVGRQMQEIYPPREVPAPSAEVTPTIVVEGLTRPGEFEDISFEVRPGEILGFFGLIGSGRSDVMKSLFGRAPAKGTVTISGEPVVVGSPTDAIDYGVGFVTENRKEEGLSLGHSVEWNISMVALDAFAGKFGFLNGRRERQAAAEQSARLSIKADSLDTIAGTLSGGNQQKIVLAKWLVTNPKVLILDEPTRGVDVGAKFEIYKIIHQLAAQGTAVIMVSSELPEVLGLSDRVVVMHEGRIGTTLDAKGLAPERVMAFAAGISS